MAERSLYPLASFFAFSTTVVLGMGWIRVPNMMPSIELYNMCAPHTFKHVTWHRSCEIQVALFHARLHVCACVCMCVRALNPTCTAFLVACLLIDAADEGIF